MRKHYWKRKILHNFKYPILSTYAVRAFFLVPEDPCTWLLPPVSTLTPTEMAPLLSSPLSSSPPYSDQNNLLIYTVKLTDRNLVHGTYIDNKLTERHTVTFTKDAGDRKNLMVFSEVVCTDLDLELVGFTLHVCNKWRCLSVPRVNTITSMRKQPLNAISWVKFQDEDAWQAE